jgi:hypothetical protein
MNDLREAIERVGARFDPGSGLEDLVTRRRRVRTRRRIVAGASALAIAAGGTLIAVRAFSASSPGPPGTIRIAATWSPSPSGSASAGAAAVPSCPTPPGDDPGQVALSRSSGPAGSSVEVSGSFLTGQSFLQLWWNADEDTFPDQVGPPPWPPTGPDLTFGPEGPGPAVELAAVAGPGETGDCSFRTEITIPDAPPGTYAVESVFGGPSAPEGGSGYFFVYGPLTFEVTG